MVLTERRHHAGNGHDSVQARFIILIFNPKLLSPQHSFRIRRTHCQQDAGVPI